MNFEWEKDKFVERWLNNRPESTATQYKYHMAKYVEFTGMTPEELVMEKWEDMKKPPIEQTDVAENRLREFNKWLQTEYKSRRGKPLAPASALTVCAGITDFYSRNKVPLNIKLSQEFHGANKGVNETEKMSAEQIKTLASYASSLRDRAIIWCMFQGGMDISTLCSLNWGHVEKEIENPPMDAVMLRMLERKKEKGRTFDSFIFKTAIKHLKIYLKDYYGSDYADKLEYDSPLFVNLYGSKAGERLQPRYVRRMLKQIAPLTGIASQSKMKKADINPLRPHALRASFSDQMAKAGASKELVDYLMGHKLKFERAYFGGEEGLREAYVGYAKVALEPQGITPDLEEKMEDLDTLKDMFAKREMRIEKLEKDVEGLENLARELFKTLDEKEKERRKESHTWKEERLQLEREIKQLGAELSEIYDRTRGFEGIETIEDLFCAFIDFLGVDKASELFEKLFKKKDKE